MGQRKSSEHSWGIRFLCCDALTLSHRDYQSCQQRRVRQRHDNQVYLYPVFYILWQLAQSLQNNVVATVDIKKLFRACSMHAGRLSVELRSIVDLAHRLCGSVVEHQSVKSEGLRFESLWELRIFFSHVRNKTRSILLLIQNLVFNIWSLLQTENNVN